MFQRVWESKLVAVVLVLLAGSAVAYRKASRREAAADRARQARLEQEVSTSLQGLNIQMKPLSEAGK